MKTEPSIAHFRQIPKCREYGRGSCEDSQWTSHRKGIIDHSASGTRICQGDTKLPVGHETGLHRRISIASRELHADHLGHRTTAPGADTAWRHGANQSEGHRQDGGYILSTSIISMAISYQRGDMRVCDGGAGRVPVSCWSWQE